jgi:hypothetical protein
VTAPQPAAGCRLCGGNLIPGVIALPVIGPAKFAYHLEGAPAIETEIDATMCAQCGAIDFTARNPGRISRAHAASLQAQRTKHDRPSRRFLTRP